MTMIRDVDIDQCWRNGAGLHAAVDDFVHVAAVKKTAACKPVTRSGSTPS